MWQQRKKSWFQGKYRIIRLLLLILLALVTTLSMPAWSTQYLPTNPQVVSQTNNAQSLLQQGIDSYRAGNYTTASQTWQKALQAFRANEDQLNQALVLSNLSLAYQHLGELEKAEDAITQSLNILQTIPSQAHDQTYAGVFAKALNTQARLQWATGQLEAAFKTWQQAAIQYHRANNESGRIGSLINQAQALQAMGLHLKAEEKLQEIDVKLEQLSDTSLQARGWLNLGKTLRRIGKLVKPENSQENEFDGSLEVLQKSLAAAQSANNKNLEISALIELGNTQRALANRATAIGKQDEAEDCVYHALEYYQNAVKQASNESNWQLQAQLNLLSLLIDTGQKLPARELINPIQKTIASLPVSRTSIYTQLNFARSLTCLLPLSETDSPLCFRSNRLPQLTDNGQKQNSSVHQLISRNEIAKIISAVVQQARQIKDVQAESYALGQLAGLYELNKQWQQAQTLTEKALEIIKNQQSAAPELSYRWEWQLGRILKQKGENKAAIAAYNLAVKSLDAARKNLLAIKSDLQFSFRDDVELVYRQKVDLLLQNPEALEIPGENLKTAVNDIDSLQLAQVENFLGCNLSYIEIDEQKVDPQAALIYPVILPDRLEVILKLPGSDRLIRRPQAINLSQQEVNVTLENLRIQLERKFITKQGQILSQQVYNWLIKPFEETFKTEKIKTLVFVLDGAFRNVPMAALYDGEQYLIEKGYAVALVPGLKLFEPTPLTEIDLNALTFGLSQVREDFPPHKGYRSLPNVETELEVVGLQVNRSRQLKNQEFTSQAMQELISSVPFPVLHLATHGQFSSDPQNTFILTWDKRLLVNDLGSVLQNRGENNPEVLELLVLSACKTADGDNRATLGLAGVAFRSGARSTVASLWYIDDKSTAELMKRFYQQLADVDAHLTKSEALRRAQVDLMQTTGYQSPYYWAAYVLVGNWL